GRPKAIAPCHGAGLTRLIPRPQAGRRQLEEMAVGIAEIDAFAAARPFGAAFDGDVLGLEPLLPGRELVGRYRKGDVDRAMPVMRRDGAAGELHGFERTAAQEKKKDAARADVVGA